MASRPLKYSKLKDLNDVDFNAIHFEKNEIKEARERIFEECLIAKDHYVKKFTEGLKEYDVHMRKKGKNPEKEMKAFSEKVASIMLNRTQLQKTLKSLKEDANEINREETAKREASLPESPVPEKKGIIKLYIQNKTGNFVRISRSEDYLQEPSVATVNIEIENDIATSLSADKCTNTPSDRVVWTYNNPLSATGSSLSPTEETLENISRTTIDDVRTAQFIHIPSTNTDQNSENVLVSGENIKSTLCTIQPKQDGATNIMIDENKIYVKVLPDEKTSDNKVQCMNNSEQLQSNAKNEGSSEEPRNGVSSAENEARRCNSREDESDVESLSSFPSATPLAKALFNLEGFKKSAVSRHLCENNDFSRVVAEEYVKFFEFHGETLDVALRKFLKQFCLIGKTQERERVLVHFSKRFLDCNPGTFKSQDAVHTLTCALMLLNTDLHGENVCRRMTCAEFIENLAELNEGENFSKELLKSLYHSIKTAPLEWAVDDEEETPATDGHSTNSDTRQSFVGHNPFLEVPNPNFATEYMKGYVMRKCCVDPNGKKTPIGKRSWKMYYADLRDLVLYLHKEVHAKGKHSLTNPKDENGFWKNQLYDSLHNAIRIHHALATRATDYTKKQHVFRLQTAHQAVYLFQTSDSKELQSWIDTINYVAACLSAPSLSGAVGSSQKIFQRPFLPVAATKLNFREQLLDLESKLRSVKEEIEEHASHPPDKSAKSRLIHEYAEKEYFLQYEMKRYRTYIFLLRSKTAQCPELEPPLVETSIGEVEEQLEKSDQIHIPVYTDNSVSVRQSLSDRFGYSATIYKAGPTDDGVETFRRPTSVSL